VAQGWGSREAENEGVKRSLGKRSVSRDNKFILLI